MVENLTLTTKAFLQMSGQKADLLKPTSSKLEIVTCRVFLNRPVSRNG